MDNECNYETELEAKMKMIDIELETEEIKAQTAREKLQYKKEFATKVFAEAGYNDSATDALKDLLSADTIADTTKAAKRLTDSIERRYKREQRTAQPVKEEKDPFLQGFRENPYGGSPEEYEKSFRKAVGLPPTQGGK